MALSLPLALDDQAYPESPTNCRHRNVKKKKNKVQWKHVEYEVFNECMIYVCKAKSYSWACDSWATDVTLQSSGALWAIYWHKDEWKTEDFKHT